MTPSNALEIIIKSHLFDSNINTLSKTLMELAERLIVESMYKWPEVTASFAIASQSLAQIAADMLTDELDKEMKNAQRSRPDIQ
jgi:hypothetical protein